MNRTRFLIVHGTNGYPEENWFLWLKEELEKGGHKVIVPLFPTPEGQSLETWLKILDIEVEELGGYGTDLIMVGHSLGPALILNRLETLNISIKAAYLVSGFTGALGFPDFDALNRTFFAKPFNWKKIQHNCPNFFVYHGDNDPYIPLEKAREFAQYLGTNILIVPKAGHFNASAGYFKFERLLRDIEEFLSIKNV